MEHKNGEWIIKGMNRNDPLRIRSPRELVNWIKEIGFLPFFSNEIDGFSAEEHVAVDCWWSGIREEDPWEWRELIAAGHEVAYGKFFDKRAGFISSEWLPVFANYRRSGYDFDARYEDGKASRREKKIMDFYIGEDEEGETIYRDTQILSTDLKKQAGFGKGGEKNYPGIVTQLQMETYLVIADFRRRVNKRGEAYGMSVSIMLPPEALWGRELVTSSYQEDPKVSWERLVSHVGKLYPAASQSDIEKLIGKEP